MKLPDPKLILYQAFPIFQWSRSYDLDIAVGDLIAGVTIALTLIPQSIAYASLAGFEPQYGLYASFIGGFVYALMGTCPQINIGPTALLSLLTFTYTSGTSPDFAVLLCFVSGIVQLIAGVVQLGFLVEFVSLPVVSGFTSAAAITIASSQIKGLLGLRFSAESFLGTWKGIFIHIQDTRLQDTLLSLVSCILLLGMKALKDIHIKDPEDEKLKRRAQILRKGLWLTGVARNAVVVILGAILAFFVYQDKNDPLILTGDVTPGLPTPQLPPFQTTVHNTTYSTGAMFSHLGLGLLVVPLVGVISNVAIAKAFARGKTLDATQEIVALGACNIIGAFFRSYPVNGSFTRSAVSDTSGVRTPAAGFYTGIIVILTLALLTPYFYFIPRAALSSVIVCAVLHMVDLDIIKKLWATSKLDLITLLGTFICCLALGIEIGLICGVGIDVILLLYYHSRPPLDVQIVNNSDLPLHYAVRPVGGLYFAGAERVRSKLASLRNPTKQSPQTTLESLSVIPDTDNLRTNTDNAINNGTISTINHTNVINDGTNSTIKGTESTYTATDSTFEGTNSTNEGKNSTRQNASTVIMNEPNGRPPNGVSKNKQTPNVLVVYCDGLYRVDYTFLQSLKMLVAEWSRTGCVLWCEVKPFVKDKLDSVLHDPVYCDRQTLPLFLAGITATEEAHATTDTQL